MLVPKTAAASLEACSDGISCRNITVSCFLSNAAHPLSRRTYGILSSQQDGFCWKSCLDVLQHGSCRKGSSSFSRNSPQQAKVRKRAQHMPKVFHYHGCFSCEQMSGQSHGGCGERATSCGADKSIATRTASRWLLESGAISQVAWASHSTSSSGSETALRSRGCYKVWLDETHQVIYEERLVPDSREDPSEDSVLLIPCLRRCTGERHTSA